MTKPSVAPDVLAALTRAVPERVSKKLDAAPRTADGWTWTFGDQVTVFTGSETVTLSSGSVLTGEGAACSCLLSPRCFHLLAVLTVLPVSAAELVVATESTQASEAAETESLTSEQKQAAKEALRVGSLVLTDGLSRVSTLRLGDLVRVAHSCRKSGLVRLESCVMAVFEAARALRDESPDFMLDRAAGALSELLLVATKLGTDAGAEWIGIARRSYLEVSSLPLAGLACEPVVSKGYAGVVTYFTDGERVFASQEVLPGDDERAVHAYDAQLRFGEISMSHREACRAGLLFAKARVSWDDRLGAGKDVTCAKTNRDESLVARLFEEPLRAQLEKADRGERQGLVFARGTMRAGRIELDSGGALPWIVPIDHPRFAYRENLERLAGSHVLLVAKTTEDGSALAPVCATLDGGRSVNLAYERLGRADVPAPHDSPPQVVATTGTHILDSARRRALRFLLVGRQSLPGAALPEVAREASRLRQALLPTGADALETLATTVHEGAAATAEAWVALQIWHRAAHTSLVRSGWGLR